MLQKKYIIKQKIKSIFQKLTGLTFYAKLPFGVDPLIDVKRVFPNYKFRVCFDVGANLGSAAKQMKQAFPHTQIYCFEPVSDTFTILNKNWVEDKKVSCYQIAFGDKIELLEAWVDKNGKSSGMNTIQHEKNQNSTSLKKETIHVVTLDHFCNENKIEFIDYLKIDTEGYELKVLQGATNLLIDQQIAFIELEVGMNPENSYHVSFEAIKTFLEGSNYRLFGIYEQVLEWPTKTPILRRVNAVYVSKKVFMEHTT